MESIPIFHFYPGGRVLIMGTSGCNLNCKYCINSHLIKERPFCYDLSPEQIVEKAKSTDCIGITFSANEPAVSLTYFLETAEEAKKQGLKVGCSTNGNFSIKETELIASSIDFANISIKGSSEKFYRDICRGGSLKTVLRTIKILFERGVHIEVTTPFVPPLDDADMQSIAAFIAGVNPQIPWHIFRFLPEYELKNLEQPPVGNLVTIWEKTRKQLDYVYLENFAGSLWVNTLCPQCGTLLIERLSKGGCGGQLMNYHLSENNCCPKCSKKIPIRGSLVNYWPENTEQFLSKKEIIKTNGIIDVGGWRSGFNLKTGKKEKISYNKEIMEIIAKYPYPGDMKMDADVWVTDVALELVNQVNPDLVLLDYYQSAIVGAVKPDITEYEQYVKNVFSEVKRFIDKTDFEPVVIGLGDLIDIRGNINLEKNINGFATSDGHYAWLYNVREKEVEKISKLVGVNKILSKDQVIKQIGGSSIFQQHIGDYLVVSEEGYLFRTLDMRNRPLYRTKSLDSIIPVYSKIGCSEDISGFYQLIYNAAKNLLINLKQRKIV